MSTLVTIKAQFVREIPSETLYRVALDIIDATNIDFDVLVFDAEHETYSHVATVYDLEIYPVGKAAADKAGLSYYRDRSAIKEYENLSDAIAFESVTEARLKLLSVNYASVVDEFSGTDIVTITSEPST